MEKSLQDWLSSFSNFNSVNMDDISIVSFIFVLCISLISSVLISYLYTTFYKSRSTGSRVHKAFPLIGISITAIFICIQFSLPLSLGLLGALSIVRFRTPIKEPEEIGFIMLVVATSLCCATFNLTLMALILIVAVVALLITNYSKGIFKRKLNDGMLILSLSHDEYREKNETLLELLSGETATGRIDSIVENQDEVVITYSFINLDDSRIPAIQNKVRTLSNNAKLNFFYNYSGEV